MKLTCPSCGADMDIDVLLAHVESREAMAQLIELSVPLSLRVVRYLRLFKPATRALSMARAVRLLTELVPDMARQAITHKGREWAAPEVLWAQAFERVLAMRDDGKLKLPLSSHGYLYETLCGLADKAEAQIEREREQARRDRRPAGQVGDLASVATVVTTTPMAAAPAGPSSHARRVRAQIEAQLAARKGAAADETGAGGDNGGAEA